jgi:hypothetical protein
LFDDGTVALPKSNAPCRIEPLARDSARDPRILTDLPRSVAVPAHGIVRKLLAFGGPGYLISVGYMDPGNWATDLGGGAGYGYTLLSVVVLSSLMAMLLQALSLRLGIATGRDLAQACRLPRRLSPPRRRGAVAPGRDRHRRLRPGRDRRHRDRA